MDKISLGKDINILEIGNEYQISGLTFSGQGKSFVVTMPHKKDDLYEPLSQLLLDNAGMDLLMRQLDLLEVEMFANDATGLTKQIVRKSQRQIDNIVQWQVFQRDNYTCRYCGRTGIPLSVDHVDLWEDGGSSSADNLVTACKSCNRDRGRMPYEDWLKSPVYVKRSESLSDKVKGENIMVALDLPRLKSLRVQNVRSR